MPATGGDPLPVSVIVVTWNCEATLVACLAALYKSAPGPPAQVVCIDNASADSSIAIALAAGADVIRMANNTGFPHAVNVALERCTAPYVLLLNPDVVVETDTILRCLQTLERRPDVGLVGANLRQPDGRADLAAARRFRTLGLLAIESLGLPRASRRLDLQYLPNWDRTTSRTVPCINGAFALISTALFREIGGLDETAFLYLEDQELCRQVALRERLVYFQADAPAIHEVSAATRASRPDQQAAAYLHRMDANIEIIRRIEGAPFAQGAILLWTLRALVGYALATLGRDAGPRMRYGKALRWLALQLTGRRPPPPVPS